MEKKLAGILNIIEKKYQFDVFESIMNAYLIFHLNLMYSSIEVEQRKNVIDKCYFPLLKVIRETDINAGIEISGITLEIINEISPEWIYQLKESLFDSTVELVGSGYSQAIGPLMPSVVNRWNQEHGLMVYEKILGIRPEIALINEMAYSRGILEHYINAGYKAIIMEWNNPYKYHPEWDKSWRYYPQILTDLRGRDIPLIWADSIAFQKFQRYAHGEIEFDEYVSYIKSHQNESDRYFPVYNNDVEIFDFRPGRFKTEAAVLTEYSEWQRITLLFNAIKQEPNINIILPSSVLKGLDTPNGGNKIHLESPEQPIPVKKQEKYNINRWALTGRGDYYINTACFALAKKLTDSNDESKRRELCYLWSSDFRTHITQNRWDAYLNRLEGFKRHFLSKTPDKKTELQEIACSPYCSGRFINLKTKDITLRLNTRKGLVIDSLTFSQYNEPLIGSLDHGYYDDIALSADFYSGHAIIEIPGVHKITDLDQGSFVLSEDGESYHISMKTSNESGNFEKKIIVEDRALRLYKNISLNQRNVCRIHPFNFTFLPTAWDINSMYVETHNGGSSLERFNLNNVGEIYHSDILSSLISAKDAFGATEGFFVVGDKNKELIFEHNPAYSAMIPTIIMKESSDSKMFFRLQYSVQEIDETFKGNERPCCYECAISIRFRAVKKV